MICERKVTAIHDEKIVMRRKVRAVEQYRDGPAMLAFACTAPISALIHLCDKPEKTGEALARVETFSRDFVRVYGK